MALTFIFLFFIRLGITILKEYVFLCFAF